MSLTPEQRETAIEAMAEADYLAGPRGSRLLWRELTRAHRDDYRRTARAALAALMSEFVVLRRDDVTEERGDAPATSHLRRLVTRWEPITNEDVVPWTTQETP